MQQFYQLPPEPGYKRLVGSNGTSWGWCLKTMKIYHDSRFNNDTLGWLICPQQFTSNCLRLPCPEPFELCVPGSSGTACPTPGTWTRSCGCRTPSTCSSTWTGAHSPSRYHHDQRTHHPETVLPHLGQVNQDFLGVAFSGLRGEELFPVVSAVWGHCEVTSGLLPPCSHVLVSFYLVL